MSDQQQVCPKCGHEATMDYENARDIKRQIRALRVSKSRLRKGQRWCLDCDHTFTPRAAAVEVGGVKPPQ